MQAKHDYSVDFNDDEYIKSEILEARKAFGSTKTTFEMYESLIKWLIIISFYCSEEILPVVQSTIYEAQDRQIYSMVE